jgi:CRISPR/Cas system Type II protein with McrA/HNH and RuvC-like nuclease domain
MVAERDGWKCAYCQRMLAEETKITLHDRFYAATLDHIVPRSQNGPSNYDNLVLSCSRCNRNKGSKKLLIFLSEDVIDWQRCHRQDPTLPDRLLEQNLINKRVNSEDVHRLLMYSIPKVSWHGKY